MKNMNVTRKANSASIKKEGLAPPYYSETGSEYQPIEGALRATGVDSAEARSSGKL